jgi:hypothetical protein
VNPWTSLADLPSPLGAPAMGVYSYSELFAIGGYTGTAYTSTVYRMVLSAGTWSTYNYSSVAARASTAYTVAGSTVTYLLGGYNSTSGALDTNIKYDTSPFTYSSALAAIPGGARQAGCAVTVGADVYLFGGVGTSGVTSTSYAYHPTDNTWDVKAAMPTGRAGHGCAYVNSKVYVFGGYDTSNAMLSTIDIYDPATNTWATSNKPSMTTPVAFAGVVTYGGLVYIVGGRTNVTSGGAGVSSAIAKMRIFDPGTSAVINGPDMPAALSAFGTVVVNGDIYTAGGYDINGNPVASAYHFDPGAMLYLMKKY